MKKTNIKNKKLVIKNKKLLKEDWASGAVAAFSVDEMKKLATTAIFGAYEAYKRAWNTCMVLPWKLVIAFRDYYFTPIYITSLLQILKKLITKKANGILNVVG